MDDENRKPPQSLGNEEEESVMMDYKWAMRERLPPDGVFQGGRGLA